MPAKEASAHEPKLPLPQSRFGEGWFVETLPDGRKIFSNGHFFLVGEPPGQVSPSKPDMVPVWNEVLRVNALKAKPVRVTQMCEEKRTVFDTLQIETYWVCIFDDSVAIDKRYHDFVLARYPNVTWKHVPKFDAPVLCYDGEIYVGCVMPVRL